MKNSDVPSAQIHSESYMNSTYRADIDGLRALAVLSVLFYHAYPQYLKGGFIGVDIFFVISGFLISQILYDQLKQDKFSLVQFYIKRIKRIFPALLTVLITSLTAGYFLLYQQEYENLGKHVGGSSLFINNIILWRESGYFDAASEFKPLLHLWSLGIEEQFYLFWPVLLFVACKKRLNTLNIILFIVICSFVINILRAQHHSVSNFYLPISRIWELAIGAMAAFYFSRYRCTTLNKVNLETWIPSLALATLLASIYFLNQSITYPGWAALLPTICTAILLLNPQSNINRNILGLSFLVRIGLISYPLYLWHWVLLSFARIIYSGSITQQLAATIIILSFILAWLTYKYIEKPIRFSEYGVKNEKRLAQCLLGIMIIIGSTGFAIKMSTGLPNRIINTEATDLNKDINGFDSYREKIHLCNLPKEKANQLTWCYQTHKTGKPQMALWGDSHADHLMPGLLKHKPETNLLFVGQSGCPPTVNIKAYWKGGEDKCLAANKIALEAILESHEIHTVIMSSLGAFYTNKKSFAADHKPPYDADHFKIESTGASTDNKYAALIHGYDTAISKLENAGKKVIWIHDIPELPFMPVACIKRPLAPQRKCAISIETVKNRQQLYDNMIINLIKKHPEMKVVNPIPAICKNGICKTSLGNHLIYRDSHHLSVTGSALVVAFLEKQKRGLFQHDNAATN